MRNELVLGIVLAVVTILLSMMILINASKIKKLEQCDCSNG